MSSNLEFARGQFSSLNSNVNSKDQWESLKVSLNSLFGSEKTVEQWKKVSIDLIFFGLILSLLFIVLDRFKMWRQENH